MILLLSAKSERYSPLTALANLLHVEMAPSWMGVGVTTLVGPAVDVVGGSRYSYAVIPIGPERRTAILAVGAKDSIPQV